MTRLNFQQYMQAEHLGLLAAADQLGGLEGATTFTIRRGLAEPGSWLSYVEAAATEAAERGAAMALGYSNNTGSNPGAVRWFNFFHQQSGGRLSERRLHDRLWASASQSSMLYGVGQANIATVPKGTPREQFWVSAIRFRGEVMQERSLIIFFVRAALALTNKPLAVMIEGVINFFTQVTSPVPARVYSEIVWRLGGILFGFHVAGGLSDPEELMRFPQEFWEAYQEGIKEEEMYRSLKECVESV
ncbi:hypothetical protein VTN00DRAFT_9794 [Thermoascus crustaceus]|uniref:uncharacterized protein n=1 Tax=Thermoascus crustaceus TaxID=5088 RepID=UPI003742F279